MKKGFTLIELLAVIVMLAIIALIATPIIINIIEDAQKNSVKSSAQLYVDGLAKSIVSKNMISEFSPSLCTISSGNVTCDGQALDYNVNGRKPTSGSITFNNGVITGYTLVFEDYTITKDQNGVSIADTTPIEFNGTFVAATSNDTHKGIVYLDPTDLSATCNATLAAQNLNNKSTPTPTGITSGCMKFYVYDNSGDNYKMILDHNTTAIIEGNTCDLDELAAQLTLDTAGWIGNPTSMTIEELASALNITIDYDNGFSYPSMTNYEWLSDYTYNRYSDNKPIINDPNEYENPTYSTMNNYTSGYWLNSKVDFHGQYDGDETYYVGRGFVGYPDLDFTNSWGIRPVITLSKSIING